MFNSPTIHLESSQRAMEVRQIAIDSSTCQTVWEMGEPYNDLQLRRSEIALHTENSIDRAPNSEFLAGNAAAASSGSSSAYSRAWHEDVGGFTVNWVKSNISWSWSSGCVQQSAGSTGWWWWTFTGWNPAYGKSSTISRSCSYARVLSAGKFNNYTFCRPLTVTAIYKDISIVGWHDGSVTGYPSVSRTTATCLPLYEHFEIVRVT